ncbi:S-layer homology domain-containing protein [Paenibacillus kobensis]|uniref:S-layer homology domain-containing protein n=1 Tax=Paenibacillus kobensis TaxID=59841 RepID=UPI000FDCA13D|nr:S-layer homology domain-containing protein [Paenibacillus kobensis]
MSIKGKIVKYTVAASVVATSFAGIPLSGKGLAEKFGVQSAYATELTATATALDSLKKVYDNLGQDGLADVEAARTAVKNLSWEQKRAIVAPITDRISAKYPLTAEQRGVASALVSDLLTAQFDANGAFIESVRTNQDYRNLAAALIAEAKLPTNTSLDSFVNYVNVIAENAKTKINNLSITQLAEIQASNDKLNEFVTSLIQDELNKTDSVFGKFAAYYGITTVEMDQVRVNLRNAITVPVYNDALYAIGTAYLKSFVNISTPGNIGGVIVDPGSSFDQQFNDLLKKLEGATDAEKAELVKKAIELAIAEINKWSKFDASKLVKIVDGKAVLEINTEINKNLEESQKVFDKLSDFFKAAKVTAALPSLKFTIDLGALEPSAAIVKLSEGAMKKWQSGSFSTIGFGIDGLVVSLPDAADYAKSLELEVGQSDASKEAAVKGYPTLSAVYDFSLKLGGQAVDQFANPISISIPLSKKDGVDQELLTVAKIVNGKLQFVGGVVADGMITESRDTFSSYVVVENKVKFSDTAAVQAWAGRQIEVLAAKGAIQGRSAGKFVPKGDITRAEFAKILISALNLESAGNKVSFTDVPSDSWYAPYVGAAVKLGIINGRTATTFAPNATITRAEMATMISRALQTTQGAAAVKDEAAALKGFSDASTISSSLKAGVAFAAENGLIIGNNGKFAPNAKANRAEAAVILYRAINFKK